VNWGTPCSRIRFSRSGQTAYVRSASTSGCSLSTSYRIWTPWLGRPTSYASGYISAHRTVVASQSLRTDPSSPPTYWIGLLTRGSRRSSWSNTDETVIWPSLFNHRGYASGRDALFLCPPSSAPTSPADPASSRVPCGYGCPNRPTDARRAIRRLALRVPHHEPAPAGRGRRRDPLARGDPRRGAADDPHLGPHRGAASRHRPGAGRLAQRHPRRDRHRHR